MYDNYSFPPIESLHVPFVFFVHSFYKLSINYNNQPTDREPVQHREALGSLSRKCLEVGYFQMIFLDLDLTMNLVGKKENALV